MVLPTHYELVLASIDLIIICSATMSTGVIVAARHGEREDYVQRDAGGNWVPTAPRPWDPPLSDGGHEGCRELGRRVARTLRRRGLPPVTVVYSSPLLRCCQSAANAIVGLKEVAGDRGANLEICVEPGLVESLSEKWYRSWCLPGSDGTWGYCARVPEGEDVKSKWQVDTVDVHPMARVSIHELLLSTIEMERSLQESCGAAIRSTFENRDIITKDNSTALHPIAESFQWCSFESQKMQKARAGAMAQRLAERHPGETVLLLSHGSPVTQLFEQITGKHWTAHGVCGYTSFSVYQHRRCGIVSKGEGEALSWTEIEINASTHALEETSAEYKSGAL